VEILNGLSVPLSWNSWSRTSRKTFHEGLIFSPNVQPLFGLFSSLLFSNHAQCLVHQYIKHLTSQHLANWHIHHIMPHILSMRPYHHTNFLPCGFCPPSSSSLGSFTMVHSTFILITWIFNDFSTQSQVWSCRRALVYIFVY
jgi:hypothetical protein